MMFSGAVPWSVLPGWMYHAQEPPPSHVHNPSLPGISWVDLVFPFFLFAMGVAVPLAMRKDFERGSPVYRLVGGILWRAVMLTARRSRPSSLA